MVDATDSCHFVPRFSYLYSNRYGALPLRLPQAQSLLGYWLIKGTDIKADGKTLGACPSL